MSAEPLSVVFGRRAVAMAITHPTVISHRGHSEHSRLRQLAEIEIVYSCLCLALPGGGTTVAQFERTSKLAHTILHTKLLSTISQIL